MNNMDLKGHLAKHIPILDFVNYICFLGLSLTTLYTADVTAMSKLSPIMGSYAHLAPLAALAIALFVAALFDADLRKHFVLACGIFTASDWKQARAAAKSMAFFVLFLAVVRLALSGGATFISSVFLADGMIEDGDTAGLEQMLSEKAATKQALALELSRQVTEARETAERNAENVVSNALAAGPARWQQLYESRNGWFLSGGASAGGEKNPEIVAYLKRIATAETQAQRIRNAGEKQAETLIATQRNALQLEQADADFSAIVRMKERQLEKAEETEWLVKIGLWVADMVMAIFAILSSIFLAAALKFQPDYVIFREETSALAIVKEAVLSIWRIVKSYGVWVVSMLDGKAEKVVDSIGATVTINGRTVAMQRRNVTATLPQRADENDDESDTESSQDTVANCVSRDYNLVALELQAALANARAYRSKIQNGKGNPDVNARGLAKWEARTAELQKELQDYSR